MTLRINNNIAALKALRFLGDTDRKLVNSLERLSSGFRINKGADDPAGLVISEQMRAQISGVNQAISNTELANAMIQTSEGALAETNNLLIRMRQLALHANNEGANDAKALEADQVEISNVIESIRRVSINTQFGTRKLLDGTSGIVGIAEGGGLSFIGATERTRTSPLEGYAVQVERVATQGRLAGTAPITTANVRGLSITLIAGGKTVKVTAGENDLPATFAGKLKEAAKTAELQLDVSLSPEGILSVEHTQFGRESKFRVISSVAGVLSELQGVAQAAIPGVDIAGKINGETAVGEGRNLMGVPGNETTEGLSVRVTGPLVTSVDEAGRETVERRPTVGMAGTVHIVNNSVAFQTGPNPGQKTTIALPTVGPEFLGREIENESNFLSLADVDVTTAQGARDAIRIIDKAVDEMTLTRGRLGAFQRYNLETNLATLRVTAENLIAAESSIRDADIAQELTEFTKNRIKLEANTAMLAQAIQFPAVIVNLIK